MAKGLEYISNIEEIIKEIKETQSDSLDKAATFIAKSLIEGGMIYAFGTGHSHMLAEEIFYRAGGLVRVYPILDEGLMLHANASRSTAIERLHGYATALLDSYPIKKDDVIIIMSNSGRNAVIVEMAIEAKKRGMKVLALTNLRHAKSVTSRHESGKLLFEVADVVIDNCGCVGDASIEFENMGRTGATSTVIGALILNSIVCKTIEIMLEEKVMPEVFSSSNIDSGDAINNRYIDKYSKQIRCL